MKEKPKKASAIGRRKFSRKKEENTEKKMLKREKRNKNCSLFIVGNVENVWQAHGFSSLSFSIARGNRRKALNL